jgi:branched-subunit amino acid ABC-type transport system permease component
MLALQFFFNGLSSGSILVLLAIGFGLILATTGEFHMAHAATFVIGGFLGWLFSEAVGLNIYLSMVVVLLLGGVIGFLFNEVLYEPLRRRKASRLVILLASLGALTLLENVMALIFGINPLFFSKTALNNAVMQQPTVAGIQIVMFVGMVVLAAIAYLFLYNMPMGREIRAVISSPFTSQVIGIETKKVQRAVYVLASALGCVAGMMMSIQSGTSPYNGTLFLINAAIAVLIGGIGSFWGAVVGALLLGLIQQYSILFFDTQWQTSITLLIFIIIILLRPSGLFSVQLRSKGV